MNEKNGFLYWILKKRRGFIIIFAAVIAVLLLVLPSLLSQEGNERGTGEIEALCTAIDGVGECRILVSYGADGESVAAVAVICDGGDRVEIKHRLTELLSSFYGIGYNRISVEKLR